MQLPCLTGGHRQLLIVFEEQPKGCCCCTWGRAVVKKKLRAEERRTGASHNASKGIIVISCHQEIVDFYLESTICSLLLSVVGRQEPTRAWPVSSLWQTDRLSKKDIFHLQCYGRTVRLSREAVSWGRSLLGLKELEAAVDIQSEGQQSGSREWVHTWVEKGQGCSPETPKWLSSPRCSLQGPQTVPPAGEHS